MSMTVTIKTVVFPLMVEKMLSIIDRPDVMKPVVFSCDVDLGGETSVRLSNGEINAYTERLIAIASRVAEKYAKHVYSVHVETHKAITSRHDTLPVPRTISSITVKFITYEKDGILYYAACSPRDKFSMKVAKRLIAERMARVQHVKSPLRVNRKDDRIISVTKEIKGIVDSRTTSPNVLVV